MVPPIKFGRDGRDSSVFSRYHRRVRKGRAPHLQLLVLFVVTPLLALLARIKVQGRENIPEGGFIVTANHPSNLDAFLVAVALRRRIFYMGKSELFKGWRGTVFALLGGFPVRRGVWDLDAFDTADALLSRNHSLAMFVEGGVSPVGSYRPAKSGLGHLAHRCGATVLPLHLDGARGLYRPWTWPRITVTIGEPIEVQQRDEPSRAADQALSELILERIKAMDPAASR